jgi:hypothetical protein
MAGIENVRFTEGHKPGEAAIVAAGQAADPSAMPLHPLDDEPAIALHDRLLTWLDHEQDRQRDNRVQMALDEDYYDHEQLSDDDLAALEERGQAPLVFNRIALAINWILGSETRTRADWKIRPRSPDDVDMAPVKTDVVKYVSDANRAPQKRSAAFKDQVVAGLGWTETGITTDPDRLPIYLRTESWRNVWYDSYAKELDLSDARYLFRQRALDLDYAEAMFPERAALLRQSGDRAGRRDGVGQDADDWYMNERLGNSRGSREQPGAMNDAGSRYVVTGSGSVDGRNRRERVLVFECWYRVPVARKLLRGAGNDAWSDGDEFDPTNVQHAAAVQNGEAQLVSNLGMRIQIAIFTRQGLLFTGPMQYRHNRFPLIPSWCYRRAKDGMPYGLTRGMRDAQDDYNKRRSKALWLLATRGIIYDEGAFSAEELENIRTELARPDYMIPKKKGYEVQIQDGAALVAPQMELAADDLAHIEAASGVTDELKGLATKALSGEAISLRQQQGTIVTATVFDHAQDAFELEGQIVLSLIEQYLTWPMVLRVEGQRGAVKFTQINQPQPMQPGDPAQYLNDITRTQADFVVDRQAWSTTQRQAMFETLVGFLASMPEQVRLNMADLVVELLDEPQAQEMAKRIRMMTGQADPEGPKTPEEAQALQQTQQEAALAKQAQMRIMMAGASEAEAKAALVQAQAGVQQATVGKVQQQVAELVSKGLLSKAQAAQILSTSLFELIQAAEVIAAMPGVAPIADELGLAVGFPDQSPHALNLEAPSAASTASAQLPNPRLTPPKQLPPPAAPPPDAPAPQPQPPRPPQPPQPGASAMPSDMRPQPPQRAAGVQRGIQTVRPDSGP